MSVLEALIFSVGAVYSVMAIAVMWRPNGWRVLKQSIEILLGVISGDLIYSERERDDESQSEREWTPDDLLHLKRGIELLAAMSEDDDDDESEAP